MDLTRRARREAEGGYHLNISRHICTAVAEAEVDLAATQLMLGEVQRKIEAATRTPNEFLRELGRPLLPDELPRAKAGLPASGRPA